MIELGDMNSEGEVLVLQVIQETVVEYNDDGEVAGSRSRIVDAVLQGDSECYPLEISENGERDGYTAVLHIAGEQQRIVVTRECVVALAERALRRWAPGLLA